MRRPVILTAVHHLTNNLAAVKYSTRLSGQLKTLFRLLLTDTTRYTADFRMLQNQHGLRQPDLLLKFQHS